VQDEDPHHAELTLLDRIRARDPSALTALDALYRPSLLGFARRLAGELGTAEDAVQEALLALWTHPPELRARGNLRAWLVTTTRHALYRRRLKDQRAALPEDLLELGAAAGWGDPELGRHVEATLARRDCLEHALARLPVDDREILGLVDIEELSLDETATALGIGLAATKSRLHRARLKLLAAVRKEQCHAG